MLAVMVTLKMDCGCTSALVDDGGRLVYCSADVCRSGWWCECVGAEDLEPHVCEHAEALMLELGMV